MTTFRIKLNSNQIDQVRCDLRDCLTIMDEGGRSNPENNSGMLWFKDWYQLRDLILKNHNILKDCALDVDQSKDRSNDLSGINDL